MPRRTALLLCLLCTSIGSALAPAGSVAATTRSASALRRPPLVLPAALGAASLRHSRLVWIVAGRPGSETARVARRFGARSLLHGTGVYEVRIARARSFARALRSAGRLSFAEPNGPAHRAAFPSDPLTPDQWWLPAVVDQSLTPPPVTPHSPLLAIADSQIDSSHPELAGHVVSTSSKAVSDEHGTAVAGVASASANGEGIVGVWPGMRVLDSVNKLNCADLVKSVDRATRAGAAVISMSYEFPVGSCFAHEVATDFAFGNGALPVAAGGNDFQSGNAPASPAIDPHVFTVSAVDRHLHSAFFSSENNAIDVSAPGVDVLTAVPPPFDTDGQPDGFESLDGTSFSAPIAAAVAAWVMQARPTLANDQVAAAIRDSAKDLGPRGWDQRFGYGLVKLRRALEQPARAHDPNEPNDDIDWVDGSLFKPDAPIFKSPDASRTVSGRLDQFEDPADVYRVRVAGHAKVRFQLKPLYGDPDLEIYKGSAKTIYSTKGRLGRSTKSGGATDTITWTNNSSATKSIYVDTYISSRVRQLDAAYHLKVSKL
jgi:hypothetical protein